MNVRGTPFLPADILGVTTATEVADKYHLTMTPSQFVAIPAFFIWCLLLLRLRGDKKNALSNRNCCDMFFRLSLLQPASFCCIPHRSWRPAGSKIVCGTRWFLVRTTVSTSTFFINLHYLRVSTPSGYSQAKVKDILSDFEKRILKLMETAAKRRTQRSPTKSARITKTLVLIKVLATSSQTLF